MSFNSWLQNLRSATGRLEAASDRLNLEVLEDRALLSFSPVASLPVDPSPLAVVTADFNNDGLLDLATMNSGGNSISVLLGNGLGGFGAANNFDTGTGPRSMAVGDFDNDGNLDLVSANAGGYTINNEWSSISLLTGNGNGTFRPRIDTVIIGQVQSMAAGDFNVDGNIDLVLTSYLRHEPIELFVALGDGQGSFPSIGGSVVLLTYPRGLAVADLNDDGISDVVTANNNGNVSVLIGNGDGTLNYSASGSSEFAAGINPWSVAVGDFTSDGIPDLVTSGLTVNVLPGLGDGTFAAPIHHSNDSVTVATADFNGDGNLDVVTAAGAVAVSVLLGAGDGTLTLPIDLTAGSSFVEVVVGDFNGDGRPDVAAANRESNAISVLLNDGNWTLPPPLLPSMIMGDVTASEGNTGTRAATFIVTLSAASAQPITVAYSAANGSTTAGGDYQAASGTLTIPAGQTTGTITVLVNGDRIAEANETFFVNLSGATNATIADAQGVGSIVDDEPRISIGDVSKEGKKGQSIFFTFTVTLSVAYDQAVTMSFRTVNGTAKSSDGDYISKTGTLTFAPGETSTTITIEVKGDSKREANETFYLDLFDSSSNSLFTKYRGIGTILNDD